MLGKMGKIKTKNQISEVYILGANAPLGPASSEGLSVCMSVCMYHFSSPPLRKTERDRKRQNDRETERQRDKMTKRQRDRESGPATKYFSKSGFHYFLPLNNLVYKCKV